MLNRIQNRSFFGKILNLIRLKPHPSYGNTEKRDNTPWDVGSVTWIVSTSVPTRRPDKTPNWTPSCVACYRLVFCYHCLSETVKNTNPFWVL